MLGSARFVSKQEWMMSVAKLKSSDLQKSGQQQVQTYSSGTGHNWATHEMPEG